MVYGIAYSQDTIGRAEDPAAAFLLSTPADGVAMGRKGPGGPKQRRIDVVRYPNGRIDYRRTPADDPVPPVLHGCVQRLRRVGSPLAEQVIAAHQRLKDTLRRAERVQIEQLMRDAVEEAKDPRLGYLLGVLWLQGMLCPAQKEAETEEERDERLGRAELYDKAGRIYAAQHFMVWGDISPRSAIPSHLAKIVVDSLDGTTATVPQAEVTPEKREEKLIEAQAQLEGARRALIRAWPGHLALMAVDLVCLEEPAGAAPVEAKRSWAKPKIVDVEMAHLRAGLEALVAHYDVHSSTRRPPACSPAPIERTDSPAPTMVVRTRRPRMPSSFGPHSPERPGAAEISYATQRLKRSIAGENDPNTTAATYIKGSG